MGLRARKGGQERITSAKNGNKRRSIGEPGKWDDDDDADYWDVQVGSETGVTNSRASFLSLLGFGRITACKHRHSHFIPEDEERP